MKSKNILVVLFFLSIIQFTMAQVTPIETIIDAKKTTYNTNSHISNKLIVKNQSYDIKQKLQENVKITNNTDLGFIKNCLNTNTYQELLSNNIAFSIEYIGEQNGNVISCSLINYGNVVSLSESEVECILTTAMSNIFSFNNIPNGITEFYFSIRRYYKFK